MATTNTDINDAIELSVEVAKAYARSGQANPEIILDLIEKRKMLIII
jgi:hypothetical protein